MFKTIKFLLNIEYNLTTWFLDYEGWKVIDKLSKTL